MPGIYIARQEHDEHDKNISEKERRTRQGRARPTAVANITRIQ